ncbi:MFS transporter [Janibacter hoylei]|uniref:MFS transporter n=1 Tax=Janibacter hoylei TaxID=364298 RepID=UPI00249017CB|nr:MFS transporter [Janibacter hoylei]
MTDTRPADPPADLTTSAHRRTGLITLAALLSAGWATNHFAALVPVLEDFAHISRPGLDAAFGLYALGLLPSLLLGGGVSDRVGRRPVVLAGLALACAGNLFMLIWPTLVGVVIGRLVVGLGVGMVASAGTAWAADQDAAKGAARAGVVLTGGFAIGPVVTALLTTALPGRAGIVAVYDDEVRGAPFVDGRRIGPALIAALPMGLWVFACVISAVMVFTGRIGDRFSGRMSPVTFALTAVILGCAYGLCLGQGLQDVERLAPREARGLVTGLFYVVSYSGFALPFVLNTYEDPIGPSAPLVVLAALALLTAVARLVDVVRSGQAATASTDRSA